MKSNHLFHALICLFLAGCSGQGNTSSMHSKNPPIFQSTDFTPPGGFTNGIEGPAVDATGNIYAVNFKKQGTIGKISPKGEAELFVELPENSVGNGIRIGKDGHLFVADYVNHNILLVDVYSKKIIVYAHNDEMNQPNDIAINSEGFLFASDPNWAESTGNIWRVDTSGFIVLLESGMGTCNGIEVSPDEKTLYVNESVQRKVWAFDLTNKGNISNKRLLIEFADFGMDGMRCDIMGNLYITRYDKGTVAIVDPQGNLLREVSMKGKKTSNIAFGGKDGKTCYVTLQDRGCIETFRAENPGREWAMMNK